MDKGADLTQKLVIGAAVVLGIIIIIIIGYSLYTKAKRAENELAGKNAVDAATTKSGNNPSISLTGEAQTKSNFNYDGLVQKGREEEKASTTFEIVNENIPVEVPVEEDLPKEEDVEPEIPQEPIEKPIAPQPATPVAPIDPDAPLTAEEIARIRALPVDNSPTGKLQTSLEVQSNGEYKARY